MIMRYPEYPKQSSKTMVLDRQKKEVIRMLEKTMLVKDSSFRKLDDPFENTNSKKICVLCKN